MNRCAGRAWAVRWWRRRRKHWVDSAAACSRSPATCAAPTRIVSTSASDTRRPAFASRGRSGRQSRTAPGPRAALRAERDERRGLRVRDRRAEQREGRGAHDAYAAQRSLRQAVVGEHHRLELSALAEELFGVAARPAFHQQLRDAPEPAVVDLARDRLLERDQPFEPLALQLLRHRLLPAERLGVGPGRVLEEERAVEP